MRSRIRGLMYGDRWWPLPLLAGSLLVTAAVVDKVMHAPQPVRITVWFAAAAVLHDALLFPGYALLDRALVALSDKWSSARPPLINYVRIPAAFAVLFFLLWLPTIAGRGDRAFFVASGLRRTDEFLRWLLLTLGFFAVSALIYLVRLVRTPRTAKERL